MTGVVALHGGGEFLAGDERFLGAWLELAAASRPIQESADHEALGDRPLHVAIVPTAAARGRPDLVGAMGTAAIERVASSMGRPVVVEVVPVLDAAAAADHGLAGRLAQADAIHLPGGDPDLIPSLLAGSVAWAAVRAAVASGAVIAGASAGAMAMAAWTWTPTGGMDGLGLVTDVPLAVVPHADAGSWDRAIARFGRGLPQGLGLLGLAERTGVLIPLAGGPWQVVGVGEVRWLPAVAATALDHDDGAPSAPSVMRDGDRFDVR